MTIVTYVPDVQGKPLSDLMLELALGLTIYCEDDPRISVGKGPRLFGVEVLTEKTDCSILESMPVWDVPGARDAIWTTLESELRQEWLCTIAQQQEEAVPQEEVGLIDGWELADY